MCPIENGFKGKKWPDVKVFTVGKTPIVHSRQMITEFHLKNSLVNMVAKTEKQGINKSKLYND